MKSVLILSSVGFWSLCNSYLSKNSFKLGQKGELRNITKAIDQKYHFQKWVERIYSYKSYPKVTQLKFAAEKLTGNLWKCPENFRRFCQKEK